MESRTRLVSEDFPNTDDPHSVLSLNAAAAFNTPSIWDFLGCCTWRRHRAAINARVTPQWEKWSGAGWCCDSEEKNCSTNVPSLFERGVATVTPFLKSFSETGHMWFKHKVFVLAQVKRSNQFSTVFYFCHKHFSFPSSILIPTKRNVLSDSLRFCSADRPMDTHKLYPHTIYSW